MSGIGKKLLWAGWGIALLAAVTCQVAVTKGFARDMRWGQPTIDVEFSQVGGWQSESFRVWGEQRFDLIISSVNHDPEYSGRHLLGDFEVRITGSGGDVLFQRLYRGERLEYRVPDGYGDKVLMGIRASGMPWQTGELAVRVTEPDPAFRTTRSQVKLWKVQREVGMGGLIIYALIIPGLVLTLVAFLLAALLVRGGHRWPLALTALTGAGFLAMLSL